MIFENQKCVHVNTLVSVHLLSHQNISLAPTVVVGLNLKGILMFKKVNFVFAILPAASTYFVSAQTAKPT